ncbi:MAG TPA: ABC transporter substrate-binding protein [Solirubrobacteraceae bacterium]|nr:ABC transporter substrate-binding protein [Solirubrobacteraceae bacterium]
MRRSHALAVFVLGAALALGACGGSSGGSGGGVTGSLTQPGLYGKLPPAGTPTHGGTITFGLLNGNQENYIFPIVPSGNASTYNYNWEQSMWLPLYNNSAYGSTPGVDYKVSLAKKPMFSDGNKTITVTLNSGYKWSDGKPVVANDVLFDIDLVKAAVHESAANWASYTPGYFPDSLTSVSTSGQYTIVMHLKRAFNPGWFLNDQLALNLYALPSTAWNVTSPTGPHLDWTVPANAKKIYDYLGKAGGQVGDFGTNPLWKIVDGPYVLSKFSPVNASFTLKPNPSYGGSPKPYANIQGITYTGITPMLNAMRTGSLDIGSVDFSQLASVSSLKANGYSVFGLPDFGWAGDIWNFEDKTGHFDSIVKQLYFRQAMAHLVNEKAIIAGIYHGAAGYAYGPIPSVPKTPYVPADSVNPSYPYDPAAAISLLKSHGWHVVPNGTTTCASPGTGSNQCGAGIPKGTPLSFSWYTLNSASGPYVPLTDEAITSEAKQAAGINIALHQQTFNYIASNFNDPDPSVAKYKNTWGVENFNGYTDSPYPTQNSIFNSTGSFNSGGYVDPKMDQLIQASVYGSDPNAVTKEASYEAQALPALFLPNYDYIWAVSKRVGGAPASYLALTQYAFWPQFWWVNKK